jgi:uncharacterized protein YuzE
MKVMYDQKTDILTVVLNEAAAVAESDEDKPGVILDYDKSGNLVSLEVLDASRRVTEARRMEFQTTG